MEEQKTIDEIRREIARGEAATVNENSRLIDALCTAIVFLPLVRVYLSNNQADPISDTYSLKAVSVAIDKAIKSTLKQIDTTIHAGTLQAYKRGESLGFTSLSGKVPEKLLKSLIEAGTFEHNERAAAAFIDRKLRGLNLSERVWRLEKGIKTQIETVLQLAILEGKSATDTATDLKKYLRNPDTLFRRVKDEAGKLQLSKAAKAYRPGIGIYRSAHKNAERLSRNEINNAYRAANWQQMQPLEFITGYQIKLSNNHPVTDICDTLKGIYPKSFKWSGWHVQCRCHAIFEIISPEQFIKLEAGQFTPTQTTKYPGMMKAWIEENRDRFKAGPTGTGVEWIDNSPELLAMLTAKQPA